jgi:hypothetical protein
MEVLRHVPAFIERQIIEERKSNAVCVGLERSTHLPQPVFFDC